ncbi:hypothetical protein [Paremcibacter congregatus]|uniref:hypothetical protein n=1 Tax=Paremcibacter congregatus TaxID=2043170 RepID=UPI003A94BCA1
MRQIREPHSPHGIKPAVSSNRDEEPETIPVGLVVFTLLLVGCALYFVSMVGSGWFEDVMQAADTGLQDLMDRLRQDPRNLPLER